MIKHYVEFVYPGFFFGETSAQEVQERDPKKIEIPNGSAGFRFYSQEEMFTQDNEMLRSAKKDYSGWFYKGREMTLADVKREMPNQEVLISNMECNKWDSIVKLDNGQCYPLEKKDIVLKDESAYDIVNALRAE